jgi:hypothetical protein
VKSVDYSDILGYTLPGNMEEPHGIEVLSTFRLGLKLTALK